MSIIAAGTTTTTALSSTGNTDGTLQFQVNGTTPSVTLNTLGAVGVGAVPNFGTSGQALVSAGSTAAPTWTTIAASQWTTSGSNISYTTGQVQIGTGSAAAPALSVAGDTNTGVFFPAADTIAFATAGSERARIASGGNFGIGTTNPNSRLDVDANVAANVPVISLTNSANWGWATSLDFRTPLTDGGAVGLAGRVSSVFESSNNYALTLNTTASGTNAERLRIGSAGQLGIGGTNYGTSGQVLTSAGSGAAPTWATPSAGAMTLISTATPSGTSFVDFTNLSTAYHYYVLVGKDIFTSGNGFTLQMVCSIDNGASFISASNYRVNGVDYDNGALSSISGQPSSFQLVTGIRTNFSASVIANLFVNPNGSNFCVNSTGQSSHNNSTGFMPGRALIGQLLANTTPVNAVRVFVGGTTLSGTFKLYGVAA
jgi:hypothetical protein